MATFNQIRGTLIKDVSGNPSNTRDGDIWYNSTSGKLTIHKVGGTWSAGNACNTARRYFQGCGTQTDGIMAGGFNPGASPSPMFVATEEFNGSTFANGGNLGTGTYAGTMFGPGTNTVFAGGGDNSSFLLTSFEYNGSAWTASSGNLPDARNAAGGCGTQTAGVLAGGNKPSADETESLEYNGSWTAVPGVLNTGRRSLNGSGTGTQTACIIAGGYIDGSAGYTGASEEYNGASWTSTPSLNTPRGNMAMNSGGTTTSAIVAGGSEPAASVATEYYDGSSWATVGSLGSARYQAGAGGTGTEMWVGAGGPLSPGLTSETFSLTTTQAVTTT